MKSATLDYAERGRRNIGTVFVGNRNRSDVYAIVDKGGKREVRKILKGLKAPNGVAFSKGTLYVAGRGRSTTMSKRNCGFRSGTRFDMGGQMTSAAQALPDADIEILANCLAGLN